MKNGHSYLDKGIYLSSESSIYKILNEKKLLEHRGKSKRKSHNRPALFSSCIIKIDAMVTAFI